MKELKRTVLIFGIIIPFVLSGQNKNILPVKNAGFESTDAAKVRQTVPDWYEYHGGVELTNDAHSGTKALRMNAPGYVRQKIQIPPDSAGKPVTVNFYAKGTGELRFVFDALKDGKSICKGRKGRVGRFPLTEEYMPYTFTMEKTPQGTTEIELKFGSWESKGATIDDVEVFTGKPETKQVAATKVELPPNIKLVNIAPYAKIKTTPYGTLVRRMVDGLNYTGLTLEKHPFIKIQSFEFIYDKPQEFAKIRFCLPSRTFVIWADTSGKGKYDKQLALEKNYDAHGYSKQKEWQWYEKSFWPAERVYAVKLVNFAKKNNAVFEFQILAPEKSVSSALLKKTHIPNGVPIVETDGIVKVAPPKAEQRYLQGFHIEPWMFNCQGWLKKNPRPALKDWPAFQKMVAGMKKMQANLVWVFPPKTWENVKGRKGGYPFDVMWPSKYFKWSYPENLLKELCNELHKEGFKVFVQYRFPNWKKLELPEGVKEKPVQGWAYREIFKGVAEELIDSDVNGVPLCLDEQYFAGARYPSLSLKDKKMSRAKTPEDKEKFKQHNLRAESNRKAFKERWKTDKLPVKQEDSELFRKWVIFYYEQTADCMRETAKAAKGKNPAVKTVTNVINCEGFNYRVRWGAAYDILGHKADIDYLGTDPYHTQGSSDFAYYKPLATAKALAAGNRKRQAIVTLNFPWGWRGRKEQPLAYEVNPPVSTRGAVMESILQGGTAVAFWRYNVAQVTNSEKYVTQAFSMLDTLAAWGGKKAATPKDIAVIRSRASEDWWQLKARLGNYKGKTRDEILAYAFYKWVAEFLITRGYPFELFYMDQPESYKNLSEFKLVILPFPYSMSDAAYKKIKAAADSGCRILAFNQRGETDELGNARTKPVLADLIKEGKIDFIAESVEQVGHFPEFINKIRGKIDKLLGDRKSIDVETYGSDVQVGCLKKSPKEKFIIIINWSGKDTVIDLGIHFPGAKLSPATKVQILQRDLNETRKLKLKGLNYFTLKDLEKFRVPINNGELKILYISPQN